MVDIHSHILPEVDDGARSWEMAVHMCHMAALDGIRHMVATPHANDEYFYDRPRLQAALEELHRRADSVISLMLGCDFHFSFENLTLLDQQPGLFTIGDTRYFLVEFSDFSIPPWVSSKLQALLETGLRPIITHPERNALLQNKPELVLQWAEMGCPVQVTANSLTGRWGERASKAAHWFLRKRAVHIIATDSHNVESRPPILSAARAVLHKQYGQEVADALTEHNPGAVIQNVELPYFPRVAY